MLNGWIRWWIEATDSSVRSDGFMALLAESGVIPGSEIRRQQSFFDGAASRLRNLADEFGNEFGSVDYDFLDLLEDEGRIPQLYALTGVPQMVANAANDQAAPDKPAPKAA